MPGFKEEDHDMNEIKEEKDTSHKKRKLNDVPEIEIDVSAPEPPSKKALRKAKKKDVGPTEKTAVKSETEATEATTKNGKDGKRSEYATKEDIRKFFVEGCTFTEATITRIHLPMGPSRGFTPQNKGFAYVDFANKKAMDEAVGLSEKFIAGRRVLIKGAQNFEGRPAEHQRAGSSKAGAAATSAHLPSRRIFVGNLGFDATKETVQEHFEPCGAITNVHLATFEDSGKCKGYGWVEFETIEAAQHAVNGFVKIAEDDEEEEEEVKDESSSSEDEQSEEKTGKKTKKRISADKKKKPRTKKVWVNRLLGRQLRMEFAEDAATRYKKRFGKDSKKGGSFGDEEQDGGSGHRGRNDRRPKEDSRYSHDTVQRLTGAIVEAKGKKLTFD
ncbi:RNA binding protein Rnp24, putative [Talaromyces stipitatus ATCC 10500]|uniref:RNA binding protein Rnp24, putative n=1 Tax=Talaromyces stipitatus (strain ATCC 10500 / CBS 375.48 / QM 6759 / NRRL 1006) TaxID=441959 RepID=B8MNM0_TALSN|nr:RNA binding protein Rnp24, putative [Talaromyces stipitatus ATCC 10500]EED14109.1 RNA binding protein Rnp24, putative [Talaromyces stipitatus ATCC 10500]